APMAVLVASLMSFGKFTELNELTALKAAGVNPIHTMTPVLVVAAILSVFLVWFSNDVLPDANQRARTLFLDIRKKKPGFDLRENEFYKGINNYTILVHRIHSDSLFDVILFQKPTSSKPRAIIKAEHGRLVGKNQMITFKIYDGAITHLKNKRENRKKKNNVEKVGFQEYRISFDLSDMAFNRSNPNDYSRSDRTMNVQSMKAVVDSLRLDINRDKKDLFAKHNLTTNIEEAAVKEKRNRSQILKNNKMDTLNKPQKRKSDFFVLNNMATPALQGLAYSTALNKF